MENSRRIVDLVVISDTHFGTIGCRAKELNKYLKSIKFKLFLIFRKGLFYYLLPNYELEKFFY